MSQQIELANLCNQGPWTADQKKELACAFNNNKMNSTAGTPEKDKVAKNQRCAFFENMVLEQTWVDVKCKDASLLVRAQALARVASSIGLINPDQPTLFRMTSILAWGDRNFEFSQEDVWKYMDKIQVFIKAAKPKDDTYIPEYPISAKDLPKSLLEVYGESVPIDVDIPELDTILAGHKQRGRHSKAPPKWLQSVPAEHREMFMASYKSKDCGHSPSSSAIGSPVSPHEEATRMAGKVNEIRTAMKPPAFHREVSGAPSQAQHTACAQLYAQGQEGIVDVKKVSAADGALSTTASAGDCGDLAEMEKEMGKATAARKKASDREKLLKRPCSHLNPTGAKLLMRKPAAAMKKPAHAEFSAKRHAVAKKVPAHAVFSAKGHAVAKKVPAHAEFSAKAHAVAKKVNMKNIFTRLRSRVHEPGIKRDKFVGFAYGHGRVRAEREGAPVLVCKEVGSIMSAKASKIWDEDYKG
jgi:hypothetical protein